MKPPLLLLTLLGALVTTAAALPPNALTLPVLNADTTLVREFTAATFCTETAPRRGLARLVWRTEAHLQGSQRLDVTVYKSGFDRGMYVTMWPLEKGRTSQDVQTRLPARPDKQIVFLTLIDLRISVDNQVTDLLLEGLQPGVNYFWRVSTRTAQGWVPSGFGVSPGPICPNDAREPVLVR
jgi:hypothetical protein